MVILVPGLAEHSGRYERTGQLLAAAGFRVRAFDLIGFGGSQGRRGDVPDWSLYLDQIEGHLSWALDQARPVVLMGCSMGGCLVLDHLLTDGSRPDLVVVTAPSLRGGAKWQRLLARVLAPVLPTLPIPNRLRAEQLSRDPEVGAAYFSDPLVYPKSTPRLGRALFAAMDRVTAGVAGIAVPTLVMQGGLDTVVPPQSTVALGEVPGVERRLFPALRHEVLNEPEGPELVAQIVEWIRERST